MMDDTPPGAAEGGGGPAGRYRRWVAARAGWVLLALAGALAIGVALASRLELRTSFAELLPSDDPGVVALNRTQKRIGDLSLLLVGIHSPDRAANVRYADALTAKMRQLPKEVNALATYHARDVLDFFKRNRWLYASEEDLQVARDTLVKEIGRRKNPLFVDLGDEGEEDANWKALRERFNRANQFSARFPDGVFASEDGRYVWIAALPPGGIYDEGAGEGLLDAVKALVAQDPPSRYHPEMTVGQFGPVPSAIAQRRAIERDVVWVTSICVLIVGLSIALYFRRLRAVPLIAFPAVTGTVLAFAAAEVAFGYLNASTVFLGSIILGNGINYAIILIARYEEERGRAAAAYEQALERAIAGTWRGTLVAAVCASAAYASLAFTSFRGFSQFGVMGAVGALLSWTATFTFIPAALAWLDRRGQSAPRPPVQIGRMGQMLVKHSRAFLALSLVVTLVSLFGATHFLRDPFEYDFTKLSTAVARTASDRAFERNRSDLFGRWPNPTLVVADDLSEVEDIRRTIRRQDAAHPGRDLIEQIVTINDALPGTAESQRRKLVLLDEIRRKLSDPALELLPEDKRKELAAATPPPDLRVLTPADLPALARRPFTETDGTVGRVVLMYPRRDGLSLDDGRALLRIASVVQHLHLDSGKILDTAGNAVIFGAMLRSVLREGPVATVVALLAVLLIVAVTLRPRVWAAYALGALLVGVVWMIGAAGLMGTRITFLNFIALPITLGIGLEYAVNVVSRYRERGDVVEAVSATGGAVSLCSWTTIVGYGSLLAAQSRALQGFGAMAILGEVACLVAAVVALPAFWAWRHGPRAQVGGEESRRAGTEGAESNGGGAPRPTGRNPVRPGAVTPPPSTHQSGQFS